MWRTVGERSRESVDAVGSREFGGPGTWGKSIQKNKEFHRSPTERRIRSTLD